MRTEPAPPTQSTVLYAEDHCALRWPLIFHAVLWPILLVAASIVLIVDPNPNLSYLLAIPLVGTALGIIAAVINRATGIRITHTRGQHRRSPPPAPSARAPSRRLRVTAARHRPAQVRVLLPVARDPAHRGGHRPRSYAGSGQVPVRRRDTRPGHLVGAVHDGRARHPGRPQPGHRSGVPATRHPPLLVQAFAARPVHGLPHLVRPHPAPRRTPRRSAQPGQRPARPSLTQGLSCPGGRPGLRLGEAHLLATSLRCKRSSVSGVTTKATTALAVGALRPPRGIPGRRRQALAGRPGSSACSPGPSWPAGRPRSA